MGEIGFILQEMNLFTPTAVSHIWRCDIKLTSMVSKQGPQGGLPDHSTLSRQLADLWLIYKNSDLRPCLRCLNSHLPTQDTRIGQERHVPTGGRHIHTANLLRACYMQRFLEECH